MRDRLCRELNGRFRDPEDPRRLYPQKTRTERAKNQPDEEEDQDGDEEEKKNAKAVTTHDD